MKFNHFFEIIWIGRNGLVSTWRQDVFCLFSYMHFHRFSDGMCMVAEWLLRGFGSDFQRFSVILDRILKELRWNRNGLVNVWRPG